MTATDGLALATRALHKSYGSRVALNGLDLSVPTGVVYGFLGPNGAGKTTTMRLLTGLIHPNSGTIEVLGQPFGRRDRHRLFDVGALIESPSFYPYLSGRENLRALAATGAPTPKGRIEELLELVGLRDRARDKVQTYSLGMKQRLGIAAALLSDPRLLLLDEPANGLDPAGIVAMRTTLRHLASTGKTVFVSSHVLGEVQQLAEVIGIIASGRLVREGPIEQLLLGEGIVRVRVAPEQLEPARSVLATLVADGDVAAIAGEDGWLSVRIAPERAADVNRVARERRDLRLRHRDRERPRVVVPGADAGRAHRQPRGHVLRRRRSGCLQGLGRRARVAGRRSLMRLFVAGLRKLVRRPATYVTFGLLVGLLALILIAVGATAGQPGAGEGSEAALLLVTFPGAYPIILSFILGLGGLFALIYGAAVAGSEWTWGTLKSAVARGESRSRYQLLSLAAIAVMLGLGLVAAFVIGVAVAVLAATIAGVSTAGVSDARDARHDPRVARARLARHRRGRRARLRHRDAGAQPARRDRRRHRRLLRRAVRLDLPARHRQVLPVQRRERPWWRRRKGSVAVVAARRCPSSSPTSRCSWSRPGWSGRSSSRRSSRSGPRSPADTPARGGFSPYRLSRYFAESTARLTAR